VEADSVRDRCRPRVPFVTSRSFERCRRLRCESGILFSFRLRSLNGLFALSCAAVHECFWGLYFGMRLDAPRAWEVSDVLFDREGNDCTGDPDRGWEIQSSESESSHACSIVTEVEMRSICYLQAIEGYIVVFGFRVSLESWIL
jgi:hypothetical protein